MNSKDYRMKAWDLLKEKYWMIFLAIIIVSALTAAANIFAIVLAGPLVVGLNIYITNIIKGRKEDLVDLFTPITDRFVNAFSASILKSVFIFLWSLLFIVPGIIKTYSYSMVEYIIAFDDNIGGTDAITKSRELMHGNKFRLFKLHLSFIGWYLLGIITFGIGLIFIAPYVKTAEAEFYLDLVDGKGSVEQVAVDQDDYSIDMNDY